MSKLRNISFADYKASELGYDEYKREIRKVLDSVDSFHLKFSCPSQLTTFKQVKPGSNRKCVRVKGASHFLMSNSRIIISAATVAHVVTKNEAALVLPEVKEKKAKELPATGPSAQ